MTMEIHIEPGEYKITHKDDRIEVGRLFVVGGTPTVEHWYLYQSGITATGCGPYTVPREGTTVEIKLFREGDGSRFSSSYKPQPEAAHYKYIRAECTLGATGRPPSPGRLAQGDGPGGQIDWGVYRILQNDILVGYVDVQGRGTVTPLEVWHLFTTPGMAYTPPGAAGGGYTLAHQKEPLAIGSGIAYNIIQAKCSAPP